METTPVLLPGESMDRGACWATALGVTKSQTRLNCHSIAQHTAGTSPTVKNARRVQLQGSPIHFCTFYLQELYQVLRGNVREKSSHTSSKGEGKTNHFEMLFSVISALMRNFYQRPTYWEFMT